MSIDTIGDVDVSISIPVGENERKLLLKIEENKDKRKFPLEKYVVFISFYLLMLSINLIKGTDKFKSLVGILK